MGVDISQGGGGGGITIETDPTALKLTGGTLTGELTLQASNSSSYVSIYSNTEYPSVTVQDMYGSWMQYSSTGITFPDGSTQTTAAGGGSLAYFSVAGSTSEGFSCEAGLDSGSTGEDNGKTYVSFYDSNSGIQHFSKLVCGQSDGYGYKQHGLSVQTQINEGSYNATFKFGWDSLANNGSGTFGWKVDPCLIFPDGTFQNTAYTGGVPLNATQQRYADAIASLTATPTVMEATGETLIQVQWAVSFQYNNNSLTYEYPKFLDAMAGNYNIAIYVGDFYPVTYIDSQWIVGSLNVLNPLSGFFYIAVTDSVNGGGFTDPTTTALSFPAGFVNWSPA